MRLILSSHSCCSFDIALEPFSAASSDSGDSSLAGGVMVLVGIFFALTLGAALLTGVLDSEVPIPIALFGSACFLSSRLACRLSSFCR